MTSPSNASATPPAVTRPLAAVAAAGEIQESGAPLRAVGDDEVDGAAERAGSVGQRVRAARDGRVARAQRIEHAVVIVAVGGRDRQAVLKQLDAVLVVVGGIEIRAAAGEEQLVAAASRSRPRGRARSAACRSCW